MFTYIEIIEPTHSLLSSTVFQEKDTGQNNVEVFSSIYHSQ